MTSAPPFDVCVIGAGLVGLSTARALLNAYDGMAIAVLDKEDHIAAHQSSHNSGVVHSGLYYQPGSLKARLCVEGRRAIYEMCDEEGVAIRRSGKLVIATEMNEIPGLDELERRGRANGLIGLRRLGPEGIREFEPHATGLAALHVPEAGVVDYPALAERLAAGLLARGADVLTGSAVTAIRHGIDHVVVTAGEKTLRTRVLINCAGLQSDRIAAMAGVESDIRIIPFRGEYYRLTDSAALRVAALIYPVPDPRFPFLGVHFTRRVDDVVEVGPNAVLALGREHYRGAGPDWDDLRDTLSSRGLRRLAMRRWTAGVRELVQSRSTRLYARQARRLVPDTRHQELVAGGAGVRAQAIRPDGSLVDDFVIERAGSTLHVLNAPSPGATACIAIGRHIATAADTLFAG